MTTTPIWVPILVALLGLAGVVVTTAVAGARAARDRQAFDDRAREDREAYDSREATRLQHERSMREAEREHQDKYRLHSERQMAYAALSGAMQRWLNILGKCRAVRSVTSRDLSAQEKLALHEAEATSDEASALVMMLAPKAIRGAYRTTSAYLMLAQVIVEDRSKPMEEVESTIDKANKAFWRLEDFMRVDLGVNPEDESRHEEFQRFNAVV